MDEPQQDPGQTLVEGELAGLVTREEDPRIASARKLVGAYQKAAQSTRLYPAHSTILKGMLDEFGEVVAAHVATYGETCPSRRPEDCRTQWRELEGGAPDLSRP